jgi:hypothetical protein
MDALCSVDRHSCPSDREPEVVDSVREIDSLERQPERIDVVDVPPFARPAHARRDMEFTADAARAEASGNAASFTAVLCKAVAHFGALLNLAQDRRAKVMLPIGLKNLLA